MEKGSVAAVVCIGLFTCITLCVYFIMRYRSTSVGLPSEKRTKEPSDWQKPGILVAGIGLGLFIVGLLNNLNTVKLQHSISVGIVVICAGVAMIVAHNLDKKQDI
ncbi:hypothetical protein AB3466_03810 [Sphingobacterium thalpophilum]|uniref:hypothetical protein n=1 Tax=Sphingobacterium thalpophilum TaxID=259 RepID=UPI0031CFF8B0